MKRRVVITGLGSINPLAHNVKDTQTAIKNGTVGIAPIARYDASKRRVHLAAEIKGYQATDYFEKKEARHLDAFIQYAIIAAKEALHDAGALNIDPYRLGVIVSSGIGGLATIESEDRRVAPEENFDRVTPFFIPMVISNMAAAHVAMQAGAQGMCTSVATACASSTNAIGDGFRHIRDHYADVMICGGTEASITPLGIGGFSAMRALHVGDDPQKASRPFDANRSGFVMGEGAAILVLEELEHALSRGAHIYAEIVGYGATCDANHITAPAEDGQAAARAMQQAIEDSGLQLDEVDYINAHGTSTSLNDLTESVAIKRAFGNKRPKVSSTKALTGHLLGATGALETMICALALEENKMPIQFGCFEQDPLCDIDLVTSDLPLRVAMTNNLGFGGHNASLVLKKWEIE